MEFFGLIAVGAAMVLAVVWVINNLGRILRFIFATSSITIGISLLDGPPEVAVSVGIVGGLLAVGISVDSGGVDIDIS